MIEASSAAARRLRDLGGADAVAPLWIETLPPAEALAAARGREGALFRLQEADALLALGRSADAAAVLAGPGLGALPPGLSALRQRLAERAGPAAPASAEVAGPEAELRRWLERVRTWRASGGV